MRKFSASLGIGVSAGIIDVVPMMIQKVGTFASASALAHWIVLGIIIAYIRMPFASWLTGVLVSLLSTIPILILVWEKTPVSVVPIVVMTTLLGIGVGVATGKLAR
jgi:hypothetical protein